MNDTRKIRKIFKSQPTIEQDAGSRLDYRLLKPKIEMQHQFPSNLNCES